MNDEIVKKIEEEILEKSTDFSKEKNSLEVKKSDFTVKRIIKIVSFVLLLALVWFLAVQYTVADKYAATVNVKSEDSATGVNPTSEKLDFGDIPKGSAMIRSITVNNGGDMDVYIKIFKYGEIAELIKEENNDFVVNSGEEENVEFLISVPVSASEREYKGNVVIFKIPKIF